MTCSALAGLVDAAPLIGFAAFMATLRSSEEPSKRLAQSTSPWTTSRSSFQEPLPKEFSVSGLSPAQSVSLNESTPWIR